MPEKFLNKYRIPSARLKNWDYGSNAMYFVTICTQNRECFFGDVVETQNIASPYQMQLSEIGKMAHQYWMEIPIHFPFVELGEFVIMPNHVHGIIIINKPLNDIGDVNGEINGEINGDVNGDGIGEINGDVIGDANGDAIGDAIVETQNFASLPEREPEPGPEREPEPGPEREPEPGPEPEPEPEPVPLPVNHNKFGPQSKNLASIVRGYKIGVTKFARNNNIDFAWQPRFHDHIIRNDKSFERISNYIINNPAKWTDDQFYTTL